jgi:hypothetical protein
MGGVTVVVDEPSLDVHVMLVEFVPPPLGFMDKPMQMESGIVKAAETSSLWKLMTFLTVSGVLHASGWFMISVTV